MGVQLHEASGHSGTARCFKCPKERHGTDPGWHFMDVQDRRGKRFRVYVCPRDYLRFAESERIRWAPLEDAVAEEALERDAPADAPALPLPVQGPEALIATLSLRGMTGWALLVRDVAAGRVRRLYLRQLPADPEIRQALVAYLQSAGAEITVSRDLMPQSLGPSGPSGGPSRD